MIWNPKPAFARGLLAASMLCVSTTGLSAPAAERPIEVGTTTQLLIDDALVASSVNVATVQATLEPGKIVLTNDLPWEQRIFYPTVIRLPNGRIRMFYNVGLTSDPRRNVLSMADSRDGIRFVKPRWPNQKVDGANSNVVLWDAHGPGIVFDQSAPLDQRFKAGYSSKGMSVAFSRDGRRFIPWSANPVIDNKTDTQQGIVWDASIRKWVWFFRYWEAPQDGRRGWTRFKGQIRSVARSESDDFIHWSPPAVVMRRTAGDPELSDFYGLQPTMRHGVMIGLLWVSDWDDDTGRLGKQRAELVVSRDHGLTWKRTDPAHPFFQLGKPGSFDAFVVWPSSIISAGDRDMIYYVGGQFAHGSLEVTNFPRNANNIGVRTLGRDRFVARRSNQNGGNLVTKLLNAPSGAKSLRLNLDTGTGAVIVTVFDTKNREIVHSLPVRGNGFDVPVRWAENVKSPFAAGPVRLSFQLRDSALYTFRFQ